MARIRGDRFDNGLFGTDGDDDIFGAQGDDFLRGSGGIDLIRGGRGDDNIGISDGLALGGVGNDELRSDGTATVGGGPGDDLIIAAGGDLYGDAAPGQSQRSVGNDSIQAWLGVESTGARMTGGGGADVFTGRHIADGHAAVIEVADFAAGVDKFRPFLAYTDGNFVFPDQLFDILSAGDGVVDNYVQPDGNTEVWSDIEGDRLVIRLHEDHFVINGVTQLSAADWAFG